MTVINLRARGPVDPKPTLAGPWRRLELVTLGSGDSLELAPGACEYLVFVVDGDGSATDPAGEIPLSSGSSLTLLRGAGTTLKSRRGPFELFVITIDC